MNKDYLFTVFTPTHNRSKLLPRLYNSLKNQTYKQFKWLVIDDGSSDDTRQVVEDFINDGIIHIEYHFIENGFLFKAMKLSSKLLNTPYIVRIDDDDELTTDCLEVFKNEWENIQRQGITNIGEIRALCIRDNGMIAGDYQPKIDDTFIDTTYIERHLNKATRLENIECRKVEIWKQLFPDSDQKLWLYDKISYFDDCLFWFRLSRLCKTRYIFKVLRLYHDTPVSLTKELTKPSKNMIYNKVFNGYMFLNSLPDYYSKMPWYMFKVLCHYGIDGYTLDLKSSDLIKALDSSVLKFLFIVISPLAWLYSRKIK